MIHSTLNETKEFCLGSGFIKAIHEYVIVDFECPNEVWEVEWHVYECVVYGGLA